MIEIFKQHLPKDVTPEEKLNRVRELLQIICLKIMYDKNNFDHMAFVGGTALRILFDLRRFSEDLDFSLIDSKGYDFSRVNEELLKGLKLYGLNAESKVKGEKNVQSILVKFSGMLKDLGLSSLPDQKLSIKIEVDANPPAGWRLERSFISKTYMFTLTHFDLPSMYATKLHACFYRKFTKGRDFYDLIWYLSKRIQPNYTLLNHAVQQTQGRSPKINQGNFKEFLLRNIKNIDFSAARKDVERFLEDKAELKLFDTEAFKSAVATAYRY